MKKMDPVIHFEMPAVDKTRTKKFYEEAFGWQMTLLGPEMGDYLLATTTETDEKTMLPKKPGGINGGFFSKHDGKGGEHPHIVIAIDDLKQSIKKVEEAGGKIIGSTTGTMEPDDIPGVGLYMSFEDSEGNLVGMLQPIPMG